jgi:putative DNA primase/helicase
VILRLSAHIAVLNFWNKAMPLPDIVSLELLKALLPAEPITVPQAQTRAPDYAEVEEALRCLPSHFGTNSYDTWRDVLMAVHSILPGPDGVALCERYVPGKPGEIERKFASFDGSGGVGIGTLFHIASQHGYQSARRNAPYSAKEDLPELSNDEIDALVRGELQAALPFDLYDYRPEDGGILDAWDEHYGHEWLYIAGYKRWAHWAGTHWEDQRTVQFERSIESLVSAMNLAAEEKLQECLGLPDEERKIAFKKATVYSNATRRTSGRISSVGSMAEKRRPAEGGKINAPNVLNFRNGTLDLDTLELREHSRGDLLTYCMPFDYDPAARAPIWIDEYLANVFVYENTTETDHTLIALVQELLGYSLTNDTSLEAMVWLYGDGGNGKTVIIEVLRALLGPLATSVDFQHLGSPGNYDLSSLVGMRVAFSTESERGGTVAEGYIKRVVSGETIKARPIYGSPFEFKSTSKVWWAMNDKPIIKSTSSSMWRRLKLIPFNRVFEGSEKDPQLRDKLMYELPGILNWALEGLQRLWANGGQFTYSYAAEEFLREYEEESNPVKQWIKERTIPASEPMTSARLLYADYAEWCKDSGRQAFNETNFGKELKRLRVQAKRSNGTKYALFLDKTSDLITDMGL